MTAATLDTITEAESPNISNRGGEPPELQSSLTTPGSVGPDYSLTPEQASRMINLTQLGNALTSGGNSMYGPVIRASEFVKAAEIAVQKVGKQKLMRLEDIVNAARESDILTQAFYHTLLSQEPYKPNQPKPQRRKPVPKQSPGHMTGPSMRKAVPNTVALRAVPVKAPTPALPVSYRPQVPIQQAPKAPIRPGYVLEPLPPYNLPLPNFKIDSGQLPEGVSLYQHATELHRSGQGPFAGLEAKVAIYHPSIPDFVREIQGSTVRVVYHPGLNELGVITGIRKDAKSGMLTGIYVKFKDKTMLLIVNSVAQNANPPDQKIWGTPGISR